MKEWKHGPWVATGALAIALVVSVGVKLRHGSSENSRPQQARGDFKDERIRDRLTSMLAALSSRGAGGGIVREATANLDALISIESPRCSPRQQTLLLRAREDVGMVGALWESYKVHAGQDSDLAEDKKAKEAIKEMYSALDRAKEEISAAAASF